MRVTSDEPASRPTPPPRPSAGVQARFVAVRAFEADGERYRCVVALDDGTSVRDALVSHDCVAAFFGGEPAPSLLLRALDECESGAGSAGGATSQLDAWAGRLRSFAGRVELRDGPMGVPLVVALHDAPGPGPCRSVGGTFGVAGGVLA